MHWVFLGQLYVSFAHEMTDECFVGDEQFFTGGAVLGLALINVLRILIPTH